MVSNDVTEVKRKTNDLYERTTTVCTDDDLSAHELVFDTLFGSIRTMEIGLMDVKDHLDKSQSHVSSAFKLERIKLPKFSVEMSEWQSFCDHFESSNHKNTTLSGTEKMVHLKSSLTGEAAALV